MTSIARYKDTSCEVLFQDYFFNNEEFTKDNITKVFEIESFVLKKFQHFNSKNVNTDSIWIDRSMLLRVCEEFFPYEKQLPIDLCEWEKDENIRLKNLRKTDKKAANLLEKNLKMNEVTLAKLSKKIGDLLIQFDRANQSALEEQNEELIKRWSDMNQDSVLNRWVDTDDCIVLDDIGKVIDEKTQKVTIETINEKKRYFQQNKEVLHTEQVKLQKHINSRKSAQAKMDGLLKVIDHRNKKIKTKFDDAYKVILEAKHKIARNEDMHELINRIGVRGLELFQNGSKIPEDMQQKWESSKTYHARLNKKLSDLFQDMTHNSMNFAIKIENEFLEQENQIKSTTGAYTGLFRQKGLIAKKNLQENYIANYNKINEEMPRNLGSEYEGKNLFEAFSDDDNFTRKTVSPQVERLNSENYQDDFQILKEKIKDYWKRVNDPTEKKANGDDSPLRKIDGKGQCIDDDDVLVLSSPSRASGKSQKRYRPNVIDIKRIETINNGTESGRKKRNNDNPRKNLNSLGGDLDNDNNGGMSPIPSPIGRSPLIKGSIQKKQSKNNLIDRLKNDMNGNLVSSKVRIAIEQNQNEEDLELVLEELNQEEEIEKDIKKSRKSGKTRSLKGNRPKAPELQIIVPGDGDDDMFSDDSQPDVDDLDEWGDVEGKLVGWSGSMTDYNNIVAPLKYDSMIIDRALNISGKGIDNEGIKYFIIGKLNKDSTVVFTQRWDTKQKSFKFEGQLSDGFFTGSWTAEGDDNIIAGQTGTFVLQPDGTDWTGNFYKDDDKILLRHKLHINEQGVFGLGNDDSGDFLILGDYARPERVIRWFKRYIHDKEIITYSGESADEVGEQFVIKGIWQFNSGDEIEYGEYKLKGLLWHGPFLEKHDWWNWQNTKNKMVVWDGWYGSDENKDMKFILQFDNLQINFDDYSLIGGGDDLNGLYKMSGGIKSMDDKLKVELIQTYENDEFISYNGVLENGRIKGYWSQGIEKSGEFETIVKMHEWLIASDEHFDQIPDEDMETVYQNVSTKGIFGIGYDERGQYFIKGEIIKEQRYCKWAKQYIGGDTISYIGRCNIHGANMVIKGVYQDKKNNINGYFETKGPFGDLRIGDVIMEPVPYVEGGVADEPDEDNKSTLSPNTRQRKLPDQMVKEKQLPSTDDTRWELIGQEDFDTDFEEHQNWKYKKELINIPWAGFQDFNQEKKLIVFQHFFIDWDGDITGEGSDDQGDFHIEGKFNMGDGSVEFTKDYQNQNETIFTGNFENGHISGTYIAGESNGIFALHFISRLWKGYIRQDGVKMDMELMLNSNIDGIYGIAKDSIGYYVLKGYITLGADKKITFTRKYMSDADQSFLYVGKMTSDGYFSKIKGQWKLDGVDDQYDFEIVGSLSTPGDYELLTKIPDLAGEGFKLFRSYDCFNADYEYKIEADD